MGRFLSLLLWLLPGSVMAVTYDAYMVHSPAFHETDIVYDVISSRDSAGVFFTGPGQYGSADAYAPVHLRDGASIYQFTCTYRLDASPSENVYLSARLLRVQKGTSRTDVIAEAATGGGNNRWETEYVNPTLFTTVDNRNFIYMVRLNIRNCFGGLCRLRYCRVSYSY